MSQIKLIGSVNMYRPRPHPSRFRNSGSPFAWFIILILLIFCFPLGIIAIFVYSKIDEWETDKRVEEYKKDHPSNFK